MSRRFTSTIAGASFLITFIGILGRGFGFLREIIYADSFGLEKEFDIYLVGVVLPITINSAVFFLAQNYIIPAYQKLKIESLENADSFLIKTIVLFFSFSVILTIILLLFASQVIGSIVNLNDDKFFEIALDVYFWSCLTIPFNAVFSVLSAYKQSHFDFRSTTISTLFPNFVIIASVLLFSKYIGVLSIPIGYFIGVLLQVVYLSVLTWSDLQKTWKKNTAVNLTTGMLSKTFFFIVIIETLNQLYVFIDRYFWSDVEVGGIAALNYATTLFSLPISIFSFALSTAIFPVFSELVGKKDYKMLNGHLNLSLKMIFMVFIPCAFLFICYGGSIIELIFQRGKFDSIGTELTTRVLIIYAFSLVFYSCYGIINKLVFSLELIKELLVSIVIIFTVKIVLNAYLVKIYQQDGLAIATSICYTLMFLFGYLIINKVIKLKGKGELLFSFLFYVVLNSLLFIIVQVLLMAFDKTTLLLNITGVVIHLVLFLLSLIIINPDEFKTMTGKFNFIYTMISKKSER